tara:strand:- start:424 stop:591 length:168 start_codon:yes stop_codon:yes gene_type:complete
MAMHIGTLISAAFSTAPAIKVLASWQSIFLLVCKSLFSVFHDVSKNALRQLMPYR